MGGYSPLHLAAHVGVAGLDAQGEHDPEGRALADSAVEADLAVVGIEEVQARRVYDELDPVYRLVWGDHVHHGLWTTGRETPAEAVEEIHAIDLETEAARVRGRAVHVWVRDGYQNARLNNARIERSLGVATTRDLKVITTLAERWGR